MRVPYLFLFVVLGIGHCSSFEEPDIVAEVEQEDQGELPVPANPFVIAIDPADVNAAILEDPELQIQRILRLRMQDEGDDDIQRQCRLECMLISSTLILLMVMGAIGSIRFS